MALRIVLFSAPLYYTNLDTIHGEVRLRLSRPETIGTIVVKLEGESSTSLTVPPAAEDKGWTYKTTPLCKFYSTKAPAPGTVFEETHKVLSQAAQIYPPKDEKPAKNGGCLPAGIHAFPFQFRIPVNNTCANAAQLAQSSGTRSKDEAKQVQHSHVKQTLPPTFDAFLSATDSTSIRYFLKATVQRSSIFKGDWHSSYEFRFLPIEPIREPPSSQEAFVRRPFTFRERREPSKRAAPLVPPKKRGTFPRANRDSLTLSCSSTQAGSSEQPVSSSSASMVCKDGAVPSVMLTAFIPYKPILTCDEPVPLRIVAQKMVPSREKVFLTSLEVRLVGTTWVRSQDLEQTKRARWVVVSSPNLCIPVTDPDAPVGSEVAIPDHIWRDKVLPDTVMPSFTTCNVSRTYLLEIRAGLTWSFEPLDNPLGLLKAQIFSRTLPSHLCPQTITLPLAFASVQVYSGLNLNEDVVDLSSKNMRRMAMRPIRPQVPDSWPVPPDPQMLNWQPIRRCGPLLPAISVCELPGTMRRHSYQAAQQYPNQHQIRYQRQLSCHQQLPTLSASASPQTPQQPAYELAVGPPPLPPRSELAVSTTPLTPGSSAVPNAVEVSGLPVIRRRPVPPPSAQQQQQQRHQTSENSLPDYDASLGTSLGQTHNSPVHGHASRQHCHMHQQQTVVSLLEDAVSSISVPRQPSTSSTAARTVARNGTALVSHHGVVSSSSMVPDVASAIDAFSFADSSDSAPMYQYQEPPPSYDEAMAETMMR